MLEFLGAGENALFVAAIALMVLIGLLQVVGLGGDIDTDADFDAHGALDWLGIGRLPLLMLLVVFLALFGMLGLIAQQASLDWTGALLSPWLAVPGAAVAALPLTGACARMLARVMPGDHTTAIALDALVGRIGQITVGRAEQGSPARARVEDHHGQAHFVMVEPDNPGQLFETGDRVLLVRQQGEVFRAITGGDHRLPRLDD